VTGGLGGATGPQPDPVRNSKKTEAIPIFRNTVGAYLTSCICEDKTFSDVGKVIQLGRRFIDELEALIYMVGSF
jgi:hypothetical protein